ncbi:hypothetical protein [Flavobacterium sp.]|uniref:hypothetical protein n=1 Tax=Flavobacterium sp. TaxID=239 RepID=UPI0025C35CD3|nr:hypothetical protein [Flavobacterium sp.]
MSLDRKQKAFRFFPIMPFDANNINFEQAVVRLLVLLHTKGKVIAKTTKDTLYPESLVDLIKDNKDSFEGVNDPIRERLMKNWISADFATTITEGKGRQGRARISNLKPLHLSTIKLLDPRIRSQDRDVSIFLYNVFKGTTIASDGDFLMSYLLEGTKREGQFNLVADESKFDELDIETQFLLRLLDNFKVDLPSTNANLVQDYKFLCEAQQKQFLIDTMKLLVYKESVPRRELFNYITVLFNFHTALFAIKSFKQINSLVKTQKSKCDTCVIIKGEADFHKLCKCDFQPKIFVDLTLGQDRICDALSKKSVENDYNEMYKYFKSHYKLVKLAEFAKTQGNQTPTLDQLTGYLDNPGLEGFFNYKLGDITVDEDLKDDPDVQAILKMNIPAIDKYVEILCNDKSNWKNLVARHKKLMGGLCNMNREDGFLQGGRGRQRKYVMGNLLLEVLVQLAVVSADPKGFKTKPITIISFVDWLKDRYGIYINEWITDSDSPETAKALNNNFLALKERLRQLGFYTDLSDASNSQVIKPRFKIEPNF